MSTWKDIVDMIVVCNITMRSVTDMGFFLYKSLKHFLKNHIIKVTPPKSTCTMINDGPPVNQTHKTIEFNLIDSWWPHEVDQEGSSKSYHVHNSKSKWKQRTVNLEGGGGKRERSTVMTIIIVRLQHFIITVVFISK